MTGSHRPEHELWIEALLASPPDPRRRAELLGCAVCRPALAELESLQAELSAAGEEQRAVLASARCPAAVPAAVPAATGRRRAAWRVPALAAALLLALVGWRLLRPAPEVAPAAPEGYDPPVVLGAAAEGLHPSGAVDAFDEPFRWTVDAGPLGWYVVRVLEDGGDDRLLAEQKRVTEQRCSWDPSLTTSWHRIRWEVLAFAADGSPVGSQSAQAWRSSP